MATVLHRPLHIITILVILLSQVGIASSVQAADNFFTVNSPDDAQDLNIGDGVCEADSGDCTLRAAVEEATFWAGATTTIELEEGATYRLNDTDPNPEFTESALPIWGEINVVINGHGSTIERSEEAPPFHLFEIISAEDSLELNDVTLRNGLATHDTGGAIKNAGKLVVNNSKFENNIAASGGAITILTGAVADIFNSTFSTNQAVGTEINIGEGGAIRNGGTLAVTNSEFLANTADGRGGGIWNSHLLTLTTVAFSENFASDGGGGLYNEKDVTITDSGFSTNSANIGGGIYNDGVLNAVNTTFSVNAATSGNGGGIANFNILDVTGGDFTQNTAVRGGAILNRLNAEANIADSTFSGNEALGGSEALGNGGAIINDGTLTVTNSDFAANIAEGLGGGIYSDDSVTVAASTFTGNSAYEGGAVYNLAAANMSATNILNNSANGNPAFETIGSGGGILNQGTLAFLDGSISENSTNGSGGGIYNSGTATLTSLVIADNTGNFTGGGGIYNNGPLDIIDSTISGNSAEEGGGIYTEDGPLTITSSTFFDNTANNGGGIYNLGGTTITNSTFAGNSSFFGGSAIWNAGQVTVRSSTISSNIVINTGNGGVFAAGPTFGVVLQNSILNDNQINCEDNGMEAIIDNGGNLSSDESCPFTGTSVNSTDPLLGPLQDNGGPTQTMALLAGSPAIGAAITTACPFTDQRGVERLDDEFCDIGAYEATAGIFVVTNTNDTGPGSFRQVMIDANASPNVEGEPDQISFDIPSEGGTITITPGQPLPMLTDPVIIDGTTQPGASCDLWPPHLLIEIDGTNTILGSGLTLGPGASGSVIRGLVINGIGENGEPDESGIKLSGSDNNRIECNFIGTSADGLTDLGNGDAGIAVFNGSDNNTIGGPAANQRNLISGNDGYGVDVAFTSTNNNIQNNFIGLNALGTGGIGNGSNGVTMNFGSTAIIQDNVIAGNGASGIATDNNASAQIFQNVIGTDPTGNTSLPNGTNGISINTAGNVIGGPPIGEDLVGQGNLISHNTLDGIIVQGALATDNVIRANSIFNNQGLGIDLAPDGPTSNDVKDGDTGPNNLQNYPNIAGAIPGVGQTVIDGRLDGEPETTYTLDFYDNESCDPSGYGEGQTYLGSKTVTTDEKGNGYFTASEGGVFTVLEELPIHHFVTATATDPAGNTSEFSQCTWVGPDNVNWLTALRLEYVADGTQFVTSFDQYLGKEGEARWYKFNIDPEDRLTITLTNLPANYDITVYKDINQVYLESLEAEDPLELAGTEFADMALSPDRITSDYLAPDRITPDRITPDVFSADVFSPDRITSDVFSPDRITSDVIAPDRITPDRITPDRITAEGFSPDRITPDRITPLLNAQLRALVAVSAFEGTTSEGITINTWTNTGDYYVRVLGRNGAFNTTQPFHVEVERMPGVCADIDFDSLPATSLTGVAGDYQTLILSDFSRMNLSATESEALEDKLAALAARPEVAGAWVDVNDDTRVAAANALADVHFACPYAKNVVAESIKSIVDEYRELNADLQYIVVIGNDYAIPFFRQPDQTMLGPESQYYPPVRDSSSSQASLRLNYVLTQDTYGASTSVSFDSQQLPIPDLAVGRLVETPSEIIGAIDSYLNMNGKALAPKSSLVSGYDFLSDAALAVKEQLDLGTGVTSTPRRPQAYSDKLIADPDLSPYATHETNPEVPLEDLPWTASQLSNALNARRHDLIFLAGHFSATSALAADFTTRYTTADLLASSANLQNAIVFSAGCHSGYNVVFEDRIPAIDVDTDWAQAFTRRGAILIAGTGYQYGDTDFVEYNERLYLEFSKQLRTGDDPVSIGQALVDAKQVYLANTPKMRGIHAKAYLETTLFGLPMIKVNMPGERLPEPEAFEATSSISLQQVDALAAVDSGPGAVLGLQVSDLPLDTPTTSNTRELVNDSDSDDTITTTYFEGEDGVLTNPAEPILPLQVETVSGPSDLTLRGVGFRGGNYEDIADVIPLTGAPTFELRGAHTLFNSPIFYPPRPWSINYYDVLSHHGNMVSLNITPAQFISDAPDVHTGVMRVYEDMDFRLFYSGYTGIGSDAAPPAILKVLSHSDGDALSFRVTAMSDIASGVQEVWVTYMDRTLTNGAWQSLDLVQDSNDPADWTGTLTDLENPENIRFMVQAASGVGLVTLSTNTGAYYIPNVDPATPPPAPSPDDPPALPTELTLIAPPTSGYYGSTATITAELSSGVDKLANMLVSLTLGSQSLQLTTNSEGRVTHIFPLNANPGLYDIRASFAGDETYAPSHEDALFTLDKQPTHLSLESATNGSTEGFAARLVDAEFNALGQQTVIFVLHDVAGPYTTLLAAFTDPSGLALPNLTAVPPGEYLVAVYFGGPIPATDIDLTNQLYGPSSASGTFDVMQRVPVLNVLDDFNRPRGAISSQWQSRNYGGYRISDNSLDVIAGGPLYWKAATFGPNQAVQATFVNVDPNASYQALLLKVQGGSNPDWQQGAMAVVYDAKGHTLRLETYQPNQSSNNKVSKWTVYAATSFTLQDGDRFGAMALADGHVTIFVNGNVVATITLNTSDQLFFNNRGGSIGLWFVAANEAVIDDFAGGTIAP